MEKNKIGTPLHLIKCMGELTMMYLTEIADKVDDALDVDFGDDD